MSFFFKILLLLYIKLLSIYCITLCNKGSTLPPETEYHCSGLPIFQNLNGNDTHCCFWKYEENNKIITRCSSINQDQFNNIDSYIKRKEEQKNYTNLEIKCIADQKLYCSNVVLDEDNIEDCSKLGISFKEDMFCCRWIYKDSTSQYKTNNYCASINEYEYLTINDYIRYKNNHPEQRYDDLTIDCFGKYLKITGFILLIFLLINI